MMNLDDLLKILQCPFSGGALRREGKRLVSENGICSYPLNEEIPVFIENPETVQKHPETHVSNQLSTKAIEFIEASDGWILNLSAGGTDLKRERAIELEYAVFRNTDVVGDAHSLPFKEGVFSSCVCMNAFEHYRNPRRVMKEIHRVLRPGGKLFLHTAGLQPLHEAPYHFYNVTRYGLEEWLKDFNLLDLGVSSNFNPIYALSWIASEIGNGIENQQDKAALSDFEKLTMREIAEFWKAPESRTSQKWEPLWRLDKISQERCAAGWEAVAQKPI